jgi:hypothetical protein
VDEVFLEIAASDDPIVEIFVDTTEVVEVFEDSFGPQGSEGPEGPVGPSDTTTALALVDHIESTDPHPNVVSTTAFEDWLDAMTPGI